MRVKHISEQLNKSGRLPILQRSKVRIRGDSAFCMRFWTCPACPQSQSSLPNTVLSSLFPFSTQGLFGISSQYRMAFTLQAERKLWRALFCSLGGVLSWISDAEFSCKAGSMCGGGNNGAGEWWGVHWLEPAGSGDRLSPLFWSKRRYVWPCSSASVPNSIAISSLSSPQNEHLLSHGSLLWYL